MLILHLQLHLVLDQNLTCLRIWCIFACAQSEPPEHPHLAVLGWNDGYNPGRPCQRWLALKHYQSRTSYFINYFIVSTKTGQIPKQGMAWYCGNGMANPYIINRACQLSLSHKPFLYFPSFFNFSQAWQLNWAMNSSFYCSCNIQQCAKFI